MLEISRTSEWRTNTKPVPYSASKASSINLSAVFEIKAAQHFRPIQIPAQLGETLVATRVVNRRKVQARCLARARDRDVKQVAAFDQCPFVVPR